MPFEMKFVVTWAQLDTNGHMANTAYLDTCVDVRFGYFETQGFSPSDFRKHGVGPVVRRDEVDYHRELRMRDPYTVTLSLAGVSPDVSRFRLRNEIRRADGQLAARVTTLGGWLDVAARKLVVPPEGLARAVLALERTEDFAELESSVK
jgi:acyl-CoA thioester hydrolase